MSLMDAMRHAPQPHYWHRIKQLTKQPNIPCLASQEVAKLFVKDTARFPLDSDVTKASGIDGLLPGSSIQEFCFEPCGYSMNGLVSRVCGFFAVPCTHWRRTCCLV